MVRVVAILGPTASGKSDAAVSLARRLPGGGEVLSCDSMMVYRGMDIGTAKPTLAERGGVPHHLIDVAGIEEPYNLKRYLVEAVAAAEGILARGRSCIVCGGTGLYAKALLEGFDLRPTDPDVAAAVARECDRSGEAALLDALRRVDPETAERVHGNRRRLLRAVEVVRITGGPLTHQRSDGLAQRYPTRVAVLMPAAEWSRERIRLRTDRMFEAGWLAEAEDLAARGLERAPTASQALGYSQMLAYFRGEIGSEEALRETIKVATSRYARRQRTWFRRQQAGAVIVPVGPDTGPAEVAARVADIATAD